MAACGGGEATDSAESAAPAGSDTAEGVTTERPRAASTDDETSAGGEDGDDGSTSDEGDPSTSTTADDDDEDPTGTDGTDDEDGATGGADDGESITGDPTIGQSDVDLRPVEPGDSGDDVLALQERLAEIGFAPGTPDGSYGGRTESAVGAFQVLVDLESTGIADLRTVDALESYRYSGLVLHAGDEGSDVEALQERLSGGPFDPGPIDGTYGTATVEAVWALEKLAGVPVDGDWGPLDEKAWDLLTSGGVGDPQKDHDQRWVEVDLSEQLVKVYDPGSAAPTLVSHASSGSGVAWSNDNHSGNSVTPLGDFEIDRRIAGWRESSLDIGRLYNPLYFNGGIALHGALSVPLYPASHGCIRLPMHVAEYLPSELPDGTPVHVLA
jgi:peptidoglycan hydrolase-like protein with peptidoglycan-binding domain